MADKIKKGDFVELDYDGFTKEENALFDTTEAKKAAAAGIYSQQAPYGPAIICVGLHQMLGGIDDSLIDATIGEEKRVDLPCDKAFGKKDASLLKIVPMNVFKKEKIQPFPGLQVQIDGLFGTVKTASGGRVIVDFNHPLANKDIYYKMTPKKIITDNKEKIQSLAAFEMNIPKQFIKVSEDAPKNFTMKIPFKMPEEIGKRLVEIMKKNIVGVENLTFVEEKPKMPEGHNDEHKHDHGHGKDAHGRSSDDPHFGHNHG
jgi:FKBP-type peptidyl-prolyl cis-trans isomerase 2